MLACPRFEFVLNTSAVVHTVLPAVHPHYSLLNPEWCNSLQLLEDLTAIIHTMVLLGACGPCKRGGGRNQQRGTQIKEGEAAWLD